MEPSGSDFLIQLVPLLVFWLIFAVPGYWIAKRKGISTANSRSEFFRCGQA